MNELTSLSLGIVLGVITGIISGFLASLAFWKYVLNKKPQIEIAPMIAKTQITAEQVLYKIKIMNKGKRTAINLRYLVQLVRELTENDFFKRTTRTVPLTKDSSFSLSPVDNRRCLGFITLRLKMRDPGFLATLGKAFRNDQDFLRKLKEGRDLENLLTRYDYLRVRVLATDSMSNVTCMFSREFRLVDMKKGDYLPQSLEISERV